MPVLEPVKTEIIQKTARNMLDFLAKKGYKLTRTTPQPDDSVKWEFEYWNNKIMSITISFDGSTWTGKCEMQGKDYQTVELETIIPSSFLKNFSRDVLKKLPNYNKSMVTWEQDMLSPFSYLLREDGMVEEPDWMEADVVLPDIMVSEELSLSPKDKKVLDAFTDEKAAESSKLVSDGKVLDGKWMGGKKLAQWSKGKVYVNKSTGTKSSDTIYRALKKITPANYFGGWT